jgi:glycosyltransferase involved in cell wall biosynthesis
LGRDIYSGIPEGHKIASLRIIQAACGAGIDTKVVSIEDSGSIKKNLAISKAPITDEKSALYLTSELWAHSSPPMYYLNEQVQSAKIFKQLRATDCDIVHYLNVTKEIFAITQRLLRVDKPCIAHLYHSEYAFHRPDFKVRLFSMKSGLFDHIFATNKSLVRYLTVQLKVKDDSVHYVPYPIDINRFKERDKRELREKYNLPEDAPMIAYIGAIYPDRGVFFLLSAFKGLLARIPNALLFVSHSRLEGDEAEWSPYFYRLANSNGLKGHVILTGPSSKIEEIYCLSDVMTLPFTQPYWITDPPLVLLEAMASGVPIVTTPVGAISEIGRDKENMIFCSPGDSMSLMWSLHWALENGDEARQIGLNARETIVKEFSMDLIGKRLKSLYRKITE